MKTFKKTCYLFVFNGFADYETSLAVAGIRKSGQYRIKTIALTKDPVRSMSGLVVTPDTDFFPATDLADIDRDNTAMLILPGGRAWEQKLNDGVTPMIAHFVLQGIPVAAICGATVFLADIGILNRTQHTSNSMAYLEHFSKGYRGQTRFVMSPSVRTEHLITASGVAMVDFARDIFETLQIAGDEPVHEWFKYFEQQIA